MPYIKQKDRNRLYGALDTFLLSLNKCGPITPGDLNFLLTSILDNRMQELGGINYDNINSAIGVIECVKLELYRRRAAPYEDKKIKENGDVYYIPYAEKKKS